MTGLKRLHAFCTKLDHYPSRLAIQQEIERSLSEPVKEFTLYPTGFKTQDEFSKAVSDIWKEGYRADVILSIGIREP